MRAESISLFIFLILIPMVSALTESKEGIGLMLLGDVGRAGSPVDDWLDQDLIIDYFEIPMAQKSLSDKELVKYTAIYFPRTMDRMLELYDMIIICEEEELFARFTTPKQHKLMYDAISEKGVALFNSLPHEDYEFAAWASTILEELVPHDFSAGYFELTGPFRISIDTQSGLPPIFTPFVKLRLEKYSGPRLGRLHPRPGSTEWARVEPFKTPFFISWEVGNRRARTSNVANDLDEPWWGSSYRGSSSANPYGGDLFLNIIYWSVGKEPITDIAIVHTVRAMFSNYLLRRSVTLALIDFVDRFGANTRELGDELTEVSEGRSVARRLYYEQRYEETFDHLQAMMDTMKEIEDRAIRLKERAFLWIYIIEWFVVTGTMLVVGFATWTLMIKRRLYREVSVTRANH